MTKREKKLLLLLLFIVFTILPYYLVTQHVVAASKESRMELENLQMEKRSYEQKKDNLDQLVIADKSYRQEIRSILKAQPNPNKSYEAHYILTNLAKESGVRMISLSIGEYKKVKLEQEDGKAVLASSKPEEFEKQVDGEQGYYGYLEPYLLQTTVNVKGVYSNILNFIDGIDHYGADFIIEEVYFEDLTKGAEVEGQLKITAYVLLTEQERSQLNDKQNAAR